LSSQQDFQVYVSIDQQFSGLITDDSDDSSDEALDSECLEQEWLESVVQAALMVARDHTPPGQMSLLITNDATIRSLNAQFRGADEVTDVLSFSAEHAGHWEGEDDGPEQAVEVAFVLPPEEPEPLGEVIVSYPQTKRQAEEHGVALEHELAHLVVHGVLHLTGHDHLEPAETALMQSKERAVLQDLGISLTLPSDQHADELTDEPAPAGGEIPARISEANQA
jgi:probable rRNA maturation factor